MSLEGFELPAGEFSWSEAKLPSDWAIRAFLFLTGFKAELVPDNLDTIIIGSGISSLTTAVLLGRVGQKVLVLEQHDQAGGCMHTFKDKGYEFDTGREYWSIVTIISKIWSLPSEN